MAVPLNDPEGKVVELVREGRDELVDLVTELVALDTTARSVGDPPRDEARLQQTLAARLRGIGAEVDLWEPEPTGRRQPLRARRPRLQGPAAACRSPGGQRRRPLAAAQRPHRRGHPGAARRLDDRSFQGRPQGRQALGPRRQRHEGWPCLAAARPRDAASRRGQAARRRRLLRQHRRGVVGRRQPGLCPARRTCRRRHLWRAHRVRRLGVLPRHRDADHHGRGPRRSRRDAPATLARGWRRQRHREGQVRARRDRRPCAPSGSGGPTRSTGAWRRPTSCRRSSRAACGRSPTRRTAVSPATSTYLPANVDADGTAKGVEAEITDWINAAANADPWLA